MFPTKAKPSLKCERVSEWTGRRARKDLKAKRSKELYGDRLSTKGVRQKKASMFNI